MIRISFIDEGFGTQDPESVAVVFETLQRFTKKIELLNHFACRRTTRTYSPFYQCIKDEKGSVVTGKLELD
jgi:exonuclease SbcC